ncbi:cytidine deaminase [Halorarius halobius]|uniref:cytidine deaminase n=1 Tax=Halorarius halobius TaxID=2962671 RepID=UPI0020CF2A55|nr:cytidine deaminase [Halorarius halobius]
METAPLTDDDEDLIAQVAATNDRTYDPEFFDGAHIVAGGVRLADGTVHEGVSLPASVGRASMCAEPVAVGSAIADGYGHDDLRTCVAVAYPRGEDETEPSVVPPCGSCRELLADYDPDLRVVVPVDGKRRVARAMDLLPTRTW